MFKCKYPTVSRRITSPYGPRLIGDKFHDGIDIGAVIPGNNDKIMAAHDGVIATTYYSKSYGNLIVINDKDTKYSTVYGHLNKVSIKSGQIVKQGDTIGFMGSTGYSTGIHLHFETRNKHYDSTYWNSHDGEFYSSYDPMLYLVDDDTLKAELMAIHNRIKNDLIAYSELTVANLSEFKQLIDKM